jgi:hypothetical protein
MPMILYVCEDCYDGDNESCGHFDRRELRVTPDERWLCEECLHESNYTDEEIRSFRVPPEYVPRTKGLAK